MRQPKSKPTNSSRQPRKKIPAAMSLKAVVPITEKQKEFTSNFFHSQVISLTGSAGTGKTFLALYKALNLVNESKDHNKVIIVRSIVSSRDIGFLKGDAEEKTAIYETPYRNIVNELYDNGTGYDQLKGLNVIEFHPSSFLRGTTFKNCVVVVDEAQNMSYQELYTIMTRVGENCKVVLTGDTKQDDLSSERYMEVSGYSAVLKILARVPNCTMVEFGHDDIVRSGFVREFIIAAEGVEIPKARSNRDKEKPFTKLLDNLSGIAFNR